ncbi:MAG: hypothetical protein C0598_13365 [Marinilabiliales bacterium]|nr:MAG: hypothetical protein C0598_13365 [Marinilabiliales bacterium]
MAKEKGPDMRPFHFKPFSLFHHRSTMKTGSDAIILGIWTNLNNTNKIIDVGCGSGIISLLLASRSNAKIDAIDIDVDSVEEANNNFLNSDFSSRLKAYNCNFNDWSVDDDYDLVVSNPPFFTNDLKSSNLRKTNARHTISLNYNDLCLGANRLLNDKGRLCVVIPYNILHILLCKLKIYSIGSHSPFRKD